MDTPAAEIPLDVPMARAMLRDQHPDLAAFDLQLVTNGWDNAIFRLGQHLAVRVPRRLAAVALIEHEQSWLPSVARRVSTAVPAPVRIGLAGDVFPWPWSVIPWFDGEPACRAPRSTVNAAAGDLATFIRELHIPSPSDAPFNPVRGTPLALRVDTMSERLGSGLVARSDEVGAAWHRALTAPVWTGGPIWVHGDLHPANILLREEHLAAVLDFGDICGGDPATDLATAWLTFDAEGRATFRAALDYDDATWERAMGWAILLATAFVTNSADNPEMFAIGARALEQVLAG